MKPLSFTDYLRENRDAMADFKRFKMDLGRVKGLLDINLENPDDGANDDCIENALEGARDFAVSFASFMNKIQQETIKNVVQLVESSDYIGPEPVKRRVHQLMRYEKLLDELRKPNRVRIERTLRGAEKALEVTER